MWAQQQVRYLGQSVSAEGITPLPPRIQDIIAAPRPTTKVEMQRYLGMVNFYHRFLPNIAEVLAPSRREERNSRHLIPPHAL